MMIFSIDRIEENLAVCEDENGRQVKFELELLPKNVREGDIIRRTDGGFIIDVDEAAERRRKMAQMQKSLFKK